MFHQHSGIVFWITHCDSRSISHIVKLLEIIWRRKCMHNCLVCTVNWDFFVCSCGAMSTDTHTCVCTHAHMHIKSHACVSKVMFSVFLDNGDFCLWTSNHVLKHPVQIINIEHLKHYTPRLRTHQGKLCDDIILLFLHCGPQSSGPIEYHVMGSAQIPCEQPVCISK